MIHNYIPTVHPNLAEPRCFENSLR